MAKIPESVIERIRARKLFTYPPFPSEHVWPDGVRIMVTDEDDEEIDQAPGEIVVHSAGPSIVLVSNDGQNWMNYSVEGCGGFLPGDFVNCWDSLDSALEDIIEFFDIGSLRLEAKNNRRDRRKEEITEAAFSQEASDRLRQIGLVANKKGVQLDTEFSFTPTDRSSAKPLLRLYRWHRGGWCLDIRSESDSDTGKARMQFGEFFHVWSTIDEAIDDLVDFWTGSQVRKSAWLKGTARKLID